MGPAPSASLTEQDVRGEAGFGDSIGIYPGFIDGYGVLILPTAGALIQAELDRQGVRHQ